MIATVVPIITMNTPVIVLKVSFSSFMTNPATVVIASVKELTNGPAIDKSKELSHVALSCYLNFGDHKNILPIQSNLLKLILYTKGRVENKIFQIGLIIFLFPLNEYSFS